MNVLANATRLVAEIIVKVAGDGVSNQVDGKLINRSTVSGMATSIIQRELNKQGAV